MLHNPMFAFTHWLRRLAAATYDALLLFALLMLGSYLVLPFTHGEAVVAGSWGYRLYLFCLVAAFNLWFWLNGGQTLGLRSWRLRVEDCATGLPPTWRRAVLRFFCSVPVWATGVGILWALFDPQQRALHERLSGTRLSLLPKPAK